MKKSKKFAKFNLLKNQHDENTRLKYIFPFLKIPYLLAPNAITNYYQIFGAVTRTKVLKQLQQQLLQHIMRYLKNYQKNLNTN